MARLCSDHKELIMPLSKLGMSNVEIARKLGVTEGTVRYYLKRFVEGKGDGRKNRSSDVSAYSTAIEIWIVENRDRPHRKTMKALYDILREFHGFTLSYDALRRYIRKHYPEILKKGARIRIETPPGMLLQIDWKEDVRVQIGSPDNWIKLQFLCFQLCFSRKLMIRVSDSKDLPTFIHAHQEAFRNFGGLPEWIRCDCLAQAVVKWHGEKSIINERYKNYLSKLDIDVFPARPGVPTDKGKVEKRIQDVFSRLNLKHRVFQSISELQEYLDRCVAELENEWKCGATGLPVAQSFLYEKNLLQPIPDVFPRLPVKEARTKVRRDGTVYFDGNYYQVPQIYMDKQVLCLHESQQIRIFHAGVEIGSFDYLAGTAGMVRLTTEAIEECPIPLSDRVRNWALEVAERQTEYYDEIREAVR